MGECLACVCRLDGARWVGESVKETPSGVEITTAACVLSIRPLTASAMRIRCAKQNVAETPSIVLLQQPSVPAFKVIKRDTSITVATEKMKVIFGRGDSTLQFADPRGKTFLSEIAGTRILDRQPYKEHRPILWNRPSFPHPGSTYLEAASSRTDSSTCAIFPVASPKSIVRSQFPSCSRARATEFSGTTTD